MLTRCPQCETIFRVSKKHISAAKGLVRCGSCKDIFNAKEHVIKSKKDLKKPAKTEIKTDTQESITAHATENNIVENSSVKNNQVVKKEPDSFDFINDGFTSTSEFKKFESSKPVKKPLQNKKPVSKADAIKRNKSNSFDSLLEKAPPKKSAEESITFKKPSVNKNSVIAKKSKISPATFESQSVQAHKVSKVNPDKEKKPNKSGNFISQNVIDIKNAFSSITKKISTKVTNKVQSEKQSDEVIKRSLENKLNNSKVSNSASPAVNDTNITITAPVKNKRPKKPAVMSLDRDSDIFTPTKTNLFKKPTEITSNKNNPVKTLEAEIPEKQATKASKPKIKSTSHLKENDALKLAIQLKKIVKEKTLKVETNLKQEIASDSKTNKVVSKKSSKEDKKVKPTIEKSSEKSIDEFINIVDIQSPIKSSEEQVDSKKQEQKIKAEKTSKTPEKKTETSDNKDPALISKEDSELTEDFDEELDEGLVHIHMETMDIPMVLRESLEELELPSRSIEMTIFMIVSLALLGLGLMLQFSVFRSIEVQQSYPALKPLITKVCKTFTCDYSGPRDIKKIQLISRDIRVHPTTKGALLISATIINKANYQQPYPNFSVKLSSLSGKTVAQRYFSPNDYLGKLSNKLLLMPPKQPIRIALEVVDPGKEAINFEFKFLSRK